MQTITDQSNKTFANEPNQSAVLKIERHEIREKLVDLYQLVKVRKNSKTIDVYGPVHM